MIILGIETSCDETAAAIVKDGREILSNVIVSQIDIFKAYGGVIPEIAARSHLEAILPVIHQAFETAGFVKPAINHLESAEPTNHTKSAEPTESLEPDWSKIDAIAVTHTPGLLGSLLIGTLTARTLAILHHKPFYPIHHLKSHIYSNWLIPQNSTEPSFPALTLLVSGGHTQIIYQKSHSDFEIIGTTRDDAVGECFDKVAKLLGLPYPGGPSISKAAKSGNPQKYPFPHPKLTAPARAFTGPASKLSPYDFSFSGLKTAVLRELQKQLGLPLNFPSHELPAKIAELDRPAKSTHPTKSSPTHHSKPPTSQTFIADFAASFQQTAIDILLEKLSLAAKNYPANSIILAGGVSANQLLREETLKLFSKDFQVFFPDVSLAGDNAAMVASAAFFAQKSGEKPTDPHHLTLLPRSPIA